ncbi:MAG: hypothetical protein KBG28_18165 [Kofleriaceae bacterium]|jgi:hypothetical protein|nr:hypothetical protein [Kofleriaceae bacterium]MBP6836664.1 hypothetical protein [Kofleriaceae bacterium]MBP9205906.1 hypothetical protein [Kofleriaceae bacterium]
MRTARAIALGLAASLLVVTGGATARAERVRPPRCGEPRPAPARLTSLRQLDWCNHDYGGHKGPLRAGRGSLHLYRQLDRPHDTINTRLAGVVYGDLDGDRQVEAAVILHIVSWFPGPTETRTSERTTLYLYQLGPTGPTELGRVDVAGPVRAVTIHRGVIDVVGADRRRERYQHQGDDGLVLVPRSP